MSDPEPLPPKKTRRRQRSSQAIDNAPKNKSDNKEKSNFTLGEVKNM